MKTSFDVVIVGAGFAGLCQARHLLLNIPNISIGIVDPRPPKRTDKDLKVGESMVEIATHFVCNSLGLIDYMIENHPPKFGFNFHWPKTPNVTNSMRDYKSRWVRTTPPYPSFQMNRAKFESDLLAMNIKSGVTFFKGSVLDLNLGKDGQKHNLTTKLKDQNETIQLSCEYAIDAAGRSFLLGKKLNNTVKESSQLLGLEQGASWMRVRDVDRNLFHGDFEELSGICSHYYSTNHFFGDGYWCWMIPSEIDSKELSVGIIYHPEKVNSKKVDTKEKLITFLEKEHTVLSRLLKSGTFIDFNKFKRIPHTSKQVFSQDKWFIIGDSASFFDAFYSYGTSTTAYQMMSVTELIKSHENSCDKITEKYEAFDDYYINSFFPYVNATYTEHMHQLKSAEVMSWRMAWDTVLFFFLHMPVFVDKWFLDLDFLKKFKQVYKIIHEAHLHIVSNMTESAQSKTSHIDMIEINKFAETSAKGLANFYKVRATYGQKQVNPFISLSLSAQTCLKLYWQFLKKSNGRRAIFNKANFKTIFNLFIVEHYCRYLYTKSSLKKNVKKIYKIVFNTQKLAQKTT